MRLVDVVVITPFPIRLLPGPDLTVVDAGDERRRRALVAVLGRVLTGGEAPGVTVEVEFAGERRVAQGGLPAEVRSSLAGRGPDPVVRPGDLDPARPALLARVRRPVSDPTAVATLVEHLRRTGDVRASDALAGLLTAAGAASTGAPLDDALRWLATVEAERDERERARAALAAVDEPVAARMLGRLAARLERHRAAGLWGPLPLVLDDALAGLPRPVVAEALALLASGGTQVLAVTDPEGAQELAGALDGGGVGELAVAR